MKYISLVLVLFFSFGARADFTEFKNHAKETAVGAFDETGWWILGVGGALTVLARQADDEVQKNHGAHQSMHESVSKVGDFWGDGAPQVLILGSQFFLDREKSIPSLEGFFMSAGVVQALKYSTQRERPSKADNLSYPSGHAQSAFALATTMTWSYGLKKTWVLWPMAVLTAYSRVADNRHWFSDVVAGATIGVLFGRAGFQHHPIVMPSVLFNEGRAEGLLLSTQFRF